MAESNEIVTVSQQLSNLNPDDINKLFHNGNSGLSGVEDSRTMKFPLEISIVQKQTGDGVFADPNDNDRNIKGMLFVKPRRVKNSEGKYVYEKLLQREDFRSSMTLTLLKVETGVEIWKKEKREGLDFPITVTYGRSKKMISADERDAWLAKYNPDDEEDGYKYTNQVRVILTPYSPLEVVEMMKRDENPFVTFTLSGGSGWRTWYDINRQMTELKKSLGIKGRLEEVLSSIFTFTLSTTITEKGYYNIAVEVGINDLTQALKYEDVVNSLANEFTFFFNTETQNEGLREVDADFMTEAVPTVSEKFQEAQKIVEQETEEKSEGDNLKDYINKKKAERGGAVEEDPIDLDDLPF